MIFDIIFDKNIKIIGDLSFRKDFIDRYIIENDYVKISRRLNLNNMDEIDEYIKTTGAEGIVAKEPNSLYKYGDRKSWIKYKNFLDISGVITGYTPGEGKRSGIMGAVEFLPDGFENTVFVGSGFTDKQLIEIKELIDNNNKIRIDVKYQNATSDNKSLRFPTFLRIREINGEEI
jgi:ATP-dependent DNA ligase